MIDNMETKIDILSREANVSREIAQVALIHSRGSISYATDMLERDTCKQIFWREAREFSF